MDWKSIIADLESLPGMTRQKIAESVGLSASAIRELANRNTKQPGYDAGVRLVALHKLHVRPEQADVA